MSNSRTCGPLSLTAWSYSIPEDGPGPIGMPHAFWLRNSPGTLGYCDWAEQVAAPRNVPLTPAPQDCACDREITIDELCAIFSKQKRKLCEDYLPYLNSTFKNYDITTCLRKAHFLAQVGHESGELRYSAEVLPKGKKEANVYDGYKGRGLIQLTYSRNYEAYGKAAHHDFMKDNKVDLEKAEWAADSAGWYWTSGSSKDLNGLADKNDLMAITARINGAFNGFEDRRVHLKAGFKTLKVTACQKAAVGSVEFLAFKDSEVYDSKIQSFAWGCWNDPKGGKSGVVKTVEARKAGYLRFLELNAVPAGKHKKEHHHFGFSPEKMVLLATEGSK